ncbi:MAG TPA: efflux RND transporter permease subunit, partial [Ottowia sp.]|nr:efflux RND transporter permease subunit [Ottowia sp.]
MALTVATGFVVDDAIVVLENITRHLEQGAARRQAALDGAREVGFTVLTISVSLVAVFIPLLFMGGQVGRMFREFAVTLSVAVLISLLISLTTTPMLCALLLRPPAAGAPARRSAAGWLRQRLGRWARGGQQGLARAYAGALDWALASPWLVVAVLLVVIGLNGYLFSAVSKGFFPDQDNGLMTGGLRADQSISSAAMADKLQQAVDILRADPSVGTVVAFSGGWRSGGGFLSAALKPPGQRPPGESTRAVINRLRPQLGRITGLRVFLNPVQELRIGGRGSNSTYQYTLKADNQADLKAWTRRLSEQMKRDARLTEVDDDQSDNSVEAFVQVDRDRAASLGVPLSSIDAALYDAFGQRQVATMYSELNQYAVVLEWAPGHTRSPLALRDVMLPVSPAQSAR